MKQQSLLLAWLIILSTQGFAQPFPCETSRIGKLVTKPLMKNETIHYEGLVKNTKDKRNLPEDFTSTSKDIDGNTIITRHRTIDKNTSIDLQFTSKKSGACVYQITSVEKDSAVHKIRLDEDGGATDWDEKTPLNFDKKFDEQKLVEQWLVYFK